MSSLPPEAIYLIATLSVMLLSTICVCSFCCTNRKKREEDKDGKVQSCDWHLVLVLAGIVAMIAAVCAVNPDR